MSIALVQGRSCCVLLLMVHCKPTGTSGTIRATPGELLARGLVSVADGVHRSGTPGKRTFKQGTGSLRQSYVARRSSTAYLATRICRYLDRVKDLVDTARLETGADQVDLLCHSGGCGWRLLCCVQMGGMSKQFAALGWVSWMGEAE